MPDSARVAVIYYSATGNVHQLAEAVAEGAAKAGADVRLRKVAELAPDDVIAASPGWREHREQTRGIPEASHEDLDWADGVLLGTPTRYGTPASQLKQFIDTTGSMWQQGKLADKVYSAFVSAGTGHGGLESTVLALGNTFYHWGGIIVPPGYTDPVMFELGNPYGTSHVAGTGGPGETELGAARYQGQRVAVTAAALKAGRAG